MLKDNKNYPKNPIFFNLKNTLCASLSQTSKVIFILTALISVEPDELSYYNFALA